MFYIYIYIYIIFLIYYLSNLSLYSSHAPERILQNEHNPFLPHTHIKVIKFKTVLKENSHFSTDNIWYFAIHN